MTKPTLDYEIKAINKGLELVCGVDEAGRGPLAGPVVAAAVRLDYDNLPEGINDSKKLSHKKRNHIFNQLIRTADIGIGVSSTDDIDKMNIKNASLHAMSNAIFNLKNNPQYVLVDGRDVPDIPYSSQAIIKGDSKSLSIAAASIVAKVIRDQIMEDLSRDYPQFGWNKNKGYGTKEHIFALKKFGRSVYHRKSFKPVSECEDIKLEFN